jgi:hypothetical protein
LEFSLDLPAHTTAFIRIDTSNIHGRKGSAVLDEGKGIEVFPNPSGSAMQLRQNLPGEVSMQILNIKGQLVLDRKQIGSEETIQALPPGTYILKIKHNGNLQTRKLIFQ